MNTATTEQRHAVYYRASGRKRGRPWLLHGTFPTRHEADEAARAIPFRHLDIWVAELKPADASGVVSDPPTAEAGQRKNRGTHQSHRADR